MIIKNMILGYVQAVKNSISPKSDFIEYYMIYNIILVISLLQIKLQFKTIIPHFRTKNRTKQANNPHSQAENDIKKWDRIPLKNKMKNIQNKY